MAHWDGSVKSEPIEEDAAIEEGAAMEVMDSQMLNVIDEAETCLNRLCSISRNLVQSTSVSTEPDSSMHQQQSGSLIFSAMDSRSSSSGSIAVSSDISTNSEDTVLYSPDESVAGIEEPSCPIVIVDDSLPPTAGSTRRPRRIRRRREAGNTSVVDLTNATLPTPSFGSEPVVVLSSDEEDNIGRVYPSAYCLPVVSLAVPINIEPRDTLDNRRRELIIIPGHYPSRSVNSNGTQRDRAPAAAAHSSSHPVAEPSPPERATSSSSEIICPICYEPLASRPVMSTYCGHLFCAECLEQSQKHAKKCPVCKKTLTRRTQTHPVYLSTM